MRPPRRRRIPTVDVVRGVLMTLIICTHALSNVDQEQSGLGVNALRLLLSGTVGFATLSGMLVGYFLIAKSGELKRVFRGYAVRAVVLTLIAHPLISIALHGPGSARSLLDFTARSIYVTDVLAILFLTIVPLTPRMAPALRLWLGIGLIVLARVVFLIPAQQAGWLMVREVLSGLDTPGRTVMLSTYPLLSIAGMFLVGSYVGNRFALAERAGTLPTLSRRLLLACLGLVVLSVMMVGVWAACRWHAGGIDAPRLKKVFYPQYTFTTYAAYLAVTILLVALLMTRASVGRIQRFFLVFGRTSLFTYVMQYYVVQTLPWALHWRHRMLPWQAALYIAVSLPFMNGVANIYDRVKAAGIRQPVATSASASASTTPSSRVL